LKGGGRKVIKGMGLGAHMFWPEESNSAKSRRGRGSFKGK